MVPNTTVGGHSSGSADSDMVTAESQEEVRKLNKVKQTAEFSHFFEDEHQAFTSFNIYLSLRNNPNAQCPDLPKTAKAKQDCVKRIVEAINSVDGAADHYMNRNQADLAANKPPKLSQAVDFINSLTYFEKQIVAWRLLKYIIRAARGQYDMPSWTLSTPGSSASKTSPKTFTFFADRFDEIIVVLKRWKSTVKNIVNDMLCMARRIAMNPGSESRQKESNKKLNDQRNEKVAYAAEQTKKRSNAEKGTPHGQGQGKAVAAARRAKKNAVRAARDSEEVEESDTKEE